MRKLREETESKVFITKTWFWQTPLVVSHLLALPLVTELLICSGSGYSLLGESHLEVTCGLVKINHLTFITSDLHRCGCMPNIGPIRFNRKYDGPFLEKNIFRNNSNTKSRKINYSASWYIFIRIWWMGVCQPFCNDEMSLSVKIIMDDNIRMAEIRKWRS